MALILFVWITTFLVIILQSRSDAFILEDPSMILLVLVLIYGTFPPFWWIMQGNEYLTPSSGRLFDLQPSYLEQFNLTLFALLFNLGILISKLVWRSSQFVRNNASIPGIPNTILYISIVFIAFHYLFILYLTASGLIGKPGEYGIQYKEIQDLPLLLAQIIKISNGFSFFLKIIIFLWIFQQHKKSNFILLIPLIFIILFIDINGARSGVMLLLFIYIILWNRFINNFSFLKLTIIAIISLVLFTMAGAYRGGGFDNGFDGLNKSLWNISLGEFDVLWGNAVELNREATAGLDFSLSLFFSEFYSWIPSYFLPFEKLSYSIWYLDEYYPDYKAAGGGNMFGLLSQISIGFGNLEAIFRGFLLGTFIIFIVKYLKNSKEWWSYPTLIYLCVWILYAVRDSSFSILGMLIQIVIPLVVLINISFGLVRIIKSKIQ